VDTLHVHLRTLTCPVAPGEKNIVKGAILKGMSKGALKEIINLARILIKCSIRRVSQ
jgi:flagellar biosynthesis regulator FlbT